MQMCKRVLILTVLFAFVASTAAVAASAQTFSPMTASEGSTASVSAPSVNPLQLPVSPSVSTAGAATAKLPTTFILFVSNQSIKLNAPAHTQWVGGYLLSGQTPLVGKTVTLYAKVGSGSWAKAASAATVTGGWIGWYLPSFTKATTVLFQIVYTGSTTYSAAPSNVIGVKIENTKTTPYLTYMYAVSLKATVPHGTKATLEARLMNGLTGLGGKTVTLWAWNGSKWVSVGTGKTLTGSNAGWITASKTSTTAGSVLLRATFNGASPYGPSASNAVQLVWT